MKTEMTKDGTGYTASFTILDVSKNINRKLFSDTLRELARNAEIGKKAEASIPNIKFEFMAHEDYSFEVFEKECEPFLQGVAS